MKYAIRLILAICLIFAIFQIASGQVLIDSYGQYVNGDKSVERIVTSGNRGYVFVEDSASGQKYEWFFPEGPNEQKNGSVPWAINTWVAFQIREIRLGQVNACFHYFVIEGDRMIEFNCGRKSSAKPDRKDQKSARINDLPDQIKKELSEFRSRAKSVWPKVLFPE